MRHAYLLVCFLSIFPMGCAELGLTGDDSPKAQLSEQQQHQHERISRAIASQDLVRGMGMGEVYRVWGQPADVEVAGRGGSGNERWIYYEGLSRGLSNSRIVYFEN